MAVMRLASPSAAALGVGLGFVVAGRHGLDVDDAGPRLHVAGQQREVLAERVALELARQVDVAQVGWPAKSMPNISWASRSCQSAPA